MNKIEKIKTEIEFRIAQWSQYTFACASQIASEAIDRIDELKGLLAFIDSLQDEPRDHFADADKMDEGLEKAANERYPSTAQTIITAFGRLTVDRFKPEREAFISGVKWQKEQMMKGAINAHVFKSYNPVSESPDKSCRGIELLYEYENSNENIPYVKAGDNIKFIIIKDNE